MNVYIFQALNRYMNREYKIVEQDVLVEYDAETKAIKTIKELSEPRKPKYE